MIRTAAYDETTTTTTSPAATPATALIKQQRATESLTESLTEITNPFEFCRVMNVDLQSI
jgi:hypothetical protein